MFFGRREDEARRIEAEGRAHLETEDWSSALEAARRLLDMSWSGGFEVRALAQRGLGDGELALSELEEGVRLAPDAGALWLLLGNLRSDAGRFELAEVAFEQALRCDREEGCEGVSEATLRFNRAITRERNGDPEAALADLDFVLRLPTPPAFAEDALWLSMRCLADLDRGPEALALSIGVLDKCSADDPRRPRLLGLRALVLDLTEQPTPEVTSAFREAVDAGYADSQLLSLGRRLSPTDADVRRRYRVIVQGRASSAPGAHVRGAHVPGAHVPGAHGFFRVFDAVAESEEQAFELCRVHLPVHSRETAVLHDAEVLEPECELEAGCHAASRLMFFADE